MLKHDLRLEGTFWLQCHSLVYPRELRKFLENPGARRSFADTGPPPLGTRWRQIAGAWREPQGVTAAVMFVDLVLLVSDTS